MSVFERGSRVVRGLALVALSAGLVGVPEPGSASRAKAHPRASTAGHAGAFEPFPGCRVPVAGPVRLVRERRAPRPVEIDFSSSDPSALHLLVIDNGASGELLPVTSARVNVARKRVLAPNRFKRHVPTIEEPIDVRATNRLVAKLAGKPGSGFDLSVVAIDDVGPVVVDVVPADGSSVSQSPVTLDFAIEDALSAIASVRCNGVDATPDAVDPALFSCTVDLAPGANVVEIEAIDTCDNESLTPIQIFLDPPSTS